MMKNSRSTCILLASVLLGGLAGYYGGPIILQLKPLGDLFLNWLFILITPLVFFSVTTAVIQLHQQKIKRVFQMTVGILMGMALIAALYMSVVVMIFPLSNSTALLLPASNTSTALSLKTSWVSLLSVSNITELFLPQHLLPLILFSILIGISVAQTTAQETLRFLETGKWVFLKAISLLMYFAPIGFFAFFAVSIHHLSTQLFSAYYQVTLLFYFAAIVYCLVAWSLYAYIGLKKINVLQFWRLLMPTTLMALATCSSAACMPINLETAKAIGVSAETADTVIPLGTVLHKQGSILGGIIKIAFLMGIFHLPWHSFSAIGLAVITGILVGTVMGAIPSGGMLGEMLILSIYGFPPETLLLIASITLLIDPIATVLNVTGNTVASVLVDRAIAKKNSTNE